MSETKTRVAFIDIARVLALFAVYMTHTGNGAGLAYSFGFKFAVQTFFLISGCMAVYDKESNYLKFVWKKFKGFMIPYFSFAAISILIKLLITNRGFDLMKESLIIVAKGCIRNEFYSAPLWYFTCAFFMEIIFKLFTYIKVKYIPFIMSVIMWAVAAFLLPNNPTKNPTFLYNIDSSLYFMIFYGLGYTVYPLLLEIMKIKEKWQRITFVISGLISISFAVLVFFDHDPFASFMETAYLSDVLIVIRTIIIIYAVLVLAKLLTSVDPLSVLGKETLYLCGNEMVIKTLFQSLLEVVGLSLVFANPLSIYIYNICCFTFGHYIIVPFEKMCVKSIKNIK